MNISVYPDGMEAMLEQICRLKQEASRIEAKFRSVGGSIDPEFQAVFNQIRAVEQDLERICMYFSRCCGFVENTITEYLNAEKTVCYMSKEYVNLRPADRKRAELVDEKVDVRGRNIDSCEAFNMGLKVEPCRINKREFLIKYKVEPGKIDEGKNILVRTWKSPCNL